MSTEQTKVNNEQEAPLLPAEDMSFLDSSGTGSNIQQDNSGALYPNTQRRKETHPNCRGRSLVGGVWYWVSGWNNLQPNNTRYVSLAYTVMTDEEVKKYITDRPAQATAATNQAPTTPQGTPVESAETTADVNKEALGEGEKKGDEIF